MKLASDAAALCPDLAADAKKLVGTSLDAILEDKTGAVLVSPDATLASLEGAEASSLFRLGDQGPSLSYVVLGATDRVELHGRTWMIRRGDRLDAVDVDSGRVHTETDAVSWAF